VVCNAVTFKTF